MRKMGSPPADGWRLRRGRHENLATWQSAFVVATLPGFQLSRFPGCTRTPQQKGCRGGAVRAPGAARGGPPLSRSARLRGTRGQGMATPMTPAPRVTSNESGELAGRRGGTRSARARGAGRAETWKSEILGTCEAAGARRRFPVFQDFRF